MTSDRRCGRIGKPAHNSSGLSWFVTSSMQLRPNRVGTLALGFGANNFPGAGARGLLTDAPLGLEARNADWGAVLGAVLLSQFHRHPIGSRHPDLSGASAVFVVVDE